MSVLRRNQMKKIYRGAATAILTLGLMSTSALTVAVESEEAHVESEKALAIGATAIWAPGTFVSNAGAALIYDFNKVSMTFGTTFFIPIQAPANKIITKLAFVMANGCAGGKVRVALYTSDSVSGSASALKADAGQVNLPSQCPSLTQVTVPIAATSITANIWYWVAINPAQTSAAHFSTLAPTGDIQSNGEPLDFNNPAIAVGFALQPQVQMQEASIPYGPFPARAPATNFSRTTAGYTIQVGMSY
jgi:hypothetical protein